MPREHSRNRNAGRIREQIPRIEIAAEYEVAQRRAADRSEDWMLDVLAELDREAYRERHDNAGNDRAARRAERCNPEDHRGPERVAENVPRCSGQAEPVQVNGQPEGNDADEKN